MSIHSLKVSPSAAQNTKQAEAKPAKKGGASFGSLMSGVADVALGATAAVAAIVPGGQGLANSLSGMTGEGGGPQDQIDKMWSMQQENQVFNMQYMELQQQMQADNRNFSTMSNLMKTRHDTAKSAINNMHA